MHADALYAYAVLRGDATLPSGVSPIPPSGPFSLVPGMGCAALVSPVPRGLFQEGPQGRAADPSWVADCAARHHAVVAACAAVGPTLPLAFGALFSSPSPLMAWLHERRDALCVGLGQVAGCAEWSVQVEEDQALHLAWLDAHDPLLAEVVGRMAAAPPGTAYLLERRRERLRKTASAARRESLMQRLGAILRAHAEALPDRLTALVAHDRHADLRAEIARVAQEFSGSGLAPRLAGPWPAYAMARSALGHG